MKKVAFILTIALVLVAGAKAQQPLVVDAGKDSVLCGVNIIDYNIEVGGTPTATGGIGSLSFNWDIYPKPYIPFSNWPEYKVWASNMLSDTSIANPLLQASLPTDTDGPICFILTVKDDSNNSVSDTVKYWWITWTTSMGNLMHTVNPGDTFTISPLPFSGGIPPYTFDWGEPSGLIGERYDYNVYPDIYIPTRKVAIPNISSTSPLWYPLEVTDSLGCSEPIGTFEGFIIVPVGVESMSAPAYATQIEVDKGKILFRAADELKRIKLFNLSGQLVAESACEGRECAVFTDETGIMLVRVYRSDGQLEIRKVYKP